MRQAKRELTDDPVLLSILELLNEKGRTEKDMVEYLGLGNGAFVHWKYDNHKSFQLHTSKMAKYLGVTPNYLLSGRDEDINTDTLSVSEIKLIRLYRQMQFQQKECLMQTAVLFTNAVKIGKIHKKYNLAVKTGGDFVVEVKNTRKPHFLRGVFS